MNTAIENTSAVLNYDIFKPCKTENVTKKLPKYGEKLLERLKATISQVQEESIEKLQVTDGKLIKLIRGLEFNLNTILRKNVVRVHEENDNFNFDLGELYQFAVKHNSQLRKHLNSLYLSSRVFKSLYKENNILQNLDMRLTHTRCKVISNLCQNDNKKSKLRHLKINKSTNPDLTLPRKVKVVLKRCSKELSKYMSNDESISRDAMMGFQKIFPNKSSKNIDVLLPSLENTVLRYYQNIQPSQKTENYIKGLKEICESQDKTGDFAMLDYCDQELAMEYVVLKSGDVFKDFSNIQKGPDENYICSEIRAEKQKSCEVTSKSNGDMLDIDDFQLIDDWEEQNGAKPLKLESTREPTPKIQEVIKPKHEPFTETKPYSQPPAKRLRRSRFAPRSDSESQEQKPLGFCSTFVDEDGSKAETKQESVFIPEPTAKEVEKEKETIINIFDDIYELPTKPKEIIIEEIKRPHVGINKNEVSKALSKILHDSFQEIISAYGKPNFDKVAKNVAESWQTSKKDANHKSKKAGLVAEEVYAKYEIRMREITMEFSNRKRKYPTKSLDIGARLSASQSHEKSPSPTPFDQSIEASLTRPKKTDVKPIVSKRITEPVSPERTRVRAIIMSYKRDMEAKAAAVAASTQETIKSDSSSTKEGSDKGEETVKEEIDKMAKPESVPLSEEPKTSVDSGTIEEHEREVRFLKQDSKVKNEASHKVHESDSDSNESNDDEVDEDDDSSSEEEQEKRSVIKEIVEETKEKQVLNKIQWLLPTESSTSNIALPVAPMFEDSPTWEGRKVFVIDALDTNNAKAFMVKSYLQKNGANVFDHSNYKQAGKDLHILLHEGWRYHDSNKSKKDASYGGASPLVSLLFLKNNSGVHFLSYDEFEDVSTFKCKTVFPHSRSCLFLDHLALTSTHPDNIRSMLEFMITERESSNRIWCLKIMGFVYRDLEAKLKAVSEGEDGDITKLLEMEKILTEYRTRYADDPTLSLVEIQSQAGDLSELQSQVLSQQFFLQRKFRHFCVLTNSINTTELDIRYLSNHGVAVLPLNTFLNNKIGKYLGS